VELWPNVEDTRQGKPSCSGTAKRQAHALRASAEFRRHLRGAVINQSPYQADTLPSWIRLVPVVFWGGYENKGHRGQSC